MNLRSLFSAAAVLASLAVPALANAQQVPFMRDTHARTVNAPSRGAQRGFDGPVQMQRQVEARRNEEMRRAQMARGAERFQRAEDGRRGDAERHGNGAPANCDHGRGAGRGQSFDPQRDVGRGPQRGFGRGGRH